MSSYSQIVINEDSLPLEIEYRGVEGVFITYDMLDSAVITGEYLDECDDHLTFMRIEFARLSDLVDDGKAIEEEQEARLVIKEYLHAVDSVFIEYQRGQIKKYKNQGKFLKPACLLLAGAAIVEGILLYLKP